MKTTQSKTKTNKQDITKQNKKNKQQQKKNKQKKKPKEYFKKKKQAKKQTNKQTSKKSKAKQNKITNLVAFKFALLHGPALNFPVCIGAYSLQHEFELDITPFEVMMYVNSNIQKEVFNSILNLPYSMTTLTYSCKYLIRYF